MLLSPRESQMGGIAGWVAVTGAREQMILADHRSPSTIPTVPFAPIVPPRTQDIYFVLAQDSLEGPLCPFAVIAVTS
jgi:hypothetical protein